MKLRNTHFPVTKIEYYLTQQYALTRYTITYIFNLINAYGLTNKHPPLRDTN